MKIQSKFRFSFWGLKSKIIIPFIKKIILFLKKIILIVPGIFLPGFYIVLSPVKQDFLTQESYKKFNINYCLCGY